MTSLVQNHAGPNDRSLHAESEKKASHDHTVGSDSFNQDLMDDVVEPTEEQYATLRRISGNIPWMAFTITFVELCERFSWYGTTAVFTNFIQRPLPPFSTTGAITQTQACYDQYSEALCTQPGAIGYGQQASTGLGTFNQFWAYVMPLLGAYIADEYLGRYKTIQLAIIFAMTGHVLLIISAIPPVIKNSSGALGLFAFALVILGMGTGGFKSNISPLLAEQIRDKRARVITLPKTGEQVIQDPFVTISRVYHYFYMMINIGSLIGGIAMVYAERYVGFWLAYMLPTVLFILAPLVLLYCKNRYVHAPPAGSVLARSIKLLRLASKGKWTWNPITTYRNFSSPTFWEDVKPSKMQDPPAWMRDSQVDDAWVDQVRRGYAACKVFTWYPLYWLAYNQMTNNLTSQSATMELGGVPNDIINNLNPLSLIIMIPLLDYTFYPALRKLRINFTPLKRIACGFIIASLAMVSATVIQYYIYKEGPCGDEMNTCDEPAPFSVWVQTIPYVLIGISEIFASITSLEYAFTKAPENMRSLIQGVALFQTAIAAALGQALLPLADDPLLIWNYGVVAVLAFLGGIAFWFTWRSLDAEEDKLNHLKETDYKGRATNVRQGSVVEDAQERRKSVVAVADAVATQQIVAGAK